MDTSPFQIEQYKDVIMCGFLIKSPPTVENKRKSGSFFTNLGCVGSRSSIFKKRWRERYCVLYKVRYRDKTEIFFEYYADSQCSKLKGRVDLEHCDCIVDDDRVGKWVNVFSLQTMHNGQKRLYHFSAPNPQTMSQWVRHLVNITGFVDIAQTMDHVPAIGSLAVDSQSTVGTRRGMSSVRATPLNSIPVVTTSKWPVESDACSGVELAQSWLEDGYGDPSTAGADYLTTGPPDDQDDYNKLPSSAHSYVNLTSAPDKNGTVLPGNSQRNDPSHTSLEAPPTLPPRPAKAIPLSQPDGNPERNIDSSSYHTHESNNGLYFNVWEASDGDGAVLSATATTGDHSPCALPIRAHHTPRSDSQRPPQQMAIPRSKARIYRRSQFLTEPSLPTSSTTAACASEYTNVPAVAPARKPAPPPPPQGVFPINAASATLPRDSPAQTSLNRIPSTNSDIALPIRVPRSEILADSNVDSDSSESCSDKEQPMDDHQSSDNELNQFNGGELQPTGGTLKPVIASSNDTAPKARTLPVPGDNLTGAPKQLNYIEPHNLDLGSSTANGHSVQPGRHLSSASPSSHTKATSVIFPRSTIPNISGPDELSSSDDYKIEYREIDPLGTNALAIVTKRYLDDELLT